MKIEGVINKDENGVFFGYIRQFPGVCAQGKTFAEVNEKVNKYFDAFIDKMKHAEIEMSEEAA